MPLHNSSFILPTVWVHRVPASTPSERWSWCVAAPLLVGKGNGHRFAKWLWKGSWRENRAQSCFPEQKHSLVNSTRRSQKPQLPSQLCSSPPSVLLQPAVSILGGPGLPALWRERWARPTGQAESSWVVDVRSFLLLSVEQAGGLGQQISFETLKTQTGT